MKYTEFAQNIKAKYPQYNDMDDLTLAKKMVDKYPQYNDIDFGETVGTKIEGFGRSIGQTATLGQAPHLAGAGQETGNVLANLTDKNNLKQMVKDYATGGVAKAVGINALKALYNDYKSGNLKENYEEGREDYKKEQNKFKTLNPKANFVGEMIGAVGSLPAGTAVSKIPTIAKFLKNAGNVKKGITAGAGWGSALGFGEGLSNTKGQAFDADKALKNAGIGAVAGGLVGGALPLAFGGVKGGIKAILNTPNKIKAGYKGDTIQYTVPNGVQTKTYKKLAENPEIQKEALRGDIGMRSQEFQDKAAEKTIGFVPEMFDKVAKDYDSLPKDIFISFDKQNTSSKLFKAIDDFGFDTKFMPNKKVAKEAKSFVQEVLHSGRTVNNEYGLTRENLQRAMNTAWEKSQKAFKDGDNAVGKLYNDFYQVLKEARATNKKVEEISAKYHDIQRVKEGIERALQVKFKKGANYRQIATKLIQEGRNRAGTQFDEALTNAYNILSKYPDLPNAKELKTAIDLAQVSYDFRPPSADKLLDKVPTQRRLLQKIYGAVFDFSPQEKAKLLAKNLKEGNITKNDILGQFDVINAGKFSTGLNRFLQNQRIFGSKFNPLANLMRRKGQQQAKLPTFLLTDGKRFNDIVRNPLILGINKRKEFVKK